MAVKGMEKEVQAELPSKGVFEQTVRPSCFKGKSVSEEPMSFLVEKILKNLARVNDIYSSPKKRLMRT